VPLSPLFLSSRADFSPRGTCFSDFFFRSLFSRAASSRQKCGLSPLRYLGPNFKFQQMQFSIRDSHGVTVQDEGEAQSNDMPIFHQSCRIHEKLASEMPFFFIVPLWFVFLLVGTVLLFFQQSRRLAYFVLAIPTGATVTAFVLSTAALFVIPRLLPQPARPWYGIFVLATYVAAIGVRALLGAAGAFFAVLRLQRAR
jgi:hypothetical protein